MRPLAILCSDLHFSHNAPVARSAEPDWYAAQKRYLDQLRVLQKSNPNCPIIIAGDIFDKWTSSASPAQLVNFLIAELPDDCYGVPGQHDLPEHRYDGIERTPYWTLVAAGKLTNIDPNDGLGIGWRIDGGSDWGLYVHGFPWGREIQPFDGPKSSGDIHLAVVHAYIWKRNTGYPGAPEEKLVESYRQKLVGYDAAVFGDNHIGFMVGDNLINCGTFMRRKADERSYRPMVGILYSDGHIEPHYLDVSADLWLDAPSQPKEDQAADTSAIVESLKQLGADSLDFRSVLYRLLEQKNTSERVRAAVAAVVP